MAKCKECGSVGACIPSCQTGAEIFEMGSPFLGELEHEQELVHAESMQILHEEHRAFQYDREMDCD